MAKKNDTSTVTYEIVDELGVIATSETGWSKEINLVSWNGSNPKYDIRDWDPSHQRMSRGLTLTEKELESIVDYYQGYKLARANE